MIPDNVREYLQGAGVPFRVTHHPPRVTAQQVAASAHISGKRFAKTVVLRRRGEFLLAVLPADELVDLTRLSELLGQPLALAEESDFERLFPGCERGAMPPLGALFDLPVLVDGQLAQNDSITFNAGTHDDLIEMRWADFFELVKPRVIDYGARLH